MDVHVGHTSDNGSGDDHRARLEITGH
jgi:hypothetical protein